MFCKLVRFVHDTPVKWFTICLSFYKPAIVMHIAHVKEFLKFRKTKKEVLISIKVDCLI